MDKTKMEEIHAWTKESGTNDLLRGVSGVRNVEYSFCPGEGWLAARYIFNDLDDMIAFPDSDGYKQARDAVLALPAYDSSRAPHEFKGFFLEDA